MVLLMAKIQNNADITSKFLEVFLTEYYYYSTFDTELVEIRGRFQRILLTATFIVEQSKVFF